MTRGHGLGPRRPFTSNGEGLTMIRRRLSLLGRAAGAAVLATVLASVGVSSAQVLVAPCLDPAVALSVEENRLTFTLPDNSNPAVLQPTSFAEQMITGADFQDFGPSVVKQLCQMPTL